MSKAELSNIEFKKELMNGVLSEQAKLIFNKCLAVGYYTINDLNISFAYEDASQNFIVYGPSKNIKKALPNARIIPENGREILIKYFSNEIDDIEAVINGDWIDLRAAQYVQLEKGDFSLIPLGVGMKLPEGFEAHIVPRSSTFKNYGIIQTNHMGVIDNSYSGDNDQWYMPVYATRDVEIPKNARICQFRIMKTQGPIYFTKVEKLDDVDRGGFGSTGK